MVCYRKSRVGIVVPNFRGGFEKGFTPWNKGKSGYKTNYPEFRRLIIHRKGGWHHSEKNKLIMSKKELGTNIIIGKEGLHLKIKRKEIL